MIIDARTLAAETTLETDVCIVGSGPAGVSLAAELAGQSFRVCLLESGGQEFDATAHALNEGETVGDPFPPLETGRARLFGGVSPLWNIRIGDNPPTHDNQIGVRYAALAAIDFERRDWVPHSGWPFDKTYLDPFYERAQRLCQLGPFDYSASTWSDAATPLFPLKGDFTSAVFQFAPSKVYFETHRATVERSPNLTCWLNATVMEIDTDAGGRVVEQLRVASGPGRQFYVRAKKFVLAAGGLENVQLLLLSRKNSSAGLGNEHDVLGRYFMDRPMIRAGRWKPDDRGLFDKAAFYDLHRVRSTPVMGRLELTAEAMRREKLLHGYLMLYPRQRSYDAAALDSARELTAALRRGKFPAGRHLVNTLRGLTGIVTSALRKNDREILIPHFAQGGWSNAQDKPRQFGQFMVYQQSEQAPHPDNRVTLGESRDHLGRQRVRLHWRWREADRHSAQRTHELLAGEIARAGLGRLEIESEDGQSIFHTPSVYHHLGATRMSDDPKQGVVDRETRVHGMANLFIAGSSVFPTGGAANPTLTIVALAIRLADKLKHDLAGG